MCLKTNKCKNEFISVYDDFNYFTVQRRNQNILSYFIPAESQPALKPSAIAVNNIELGHTNQTVGCQLRMHNYHNYVYYL